MNVAHSCAQFLLRHARARDRYMRRARGAALPEYKSVYVDCARHANKMIVRELRWMRGRDWAHDMPDAIRGGVHR